MRNQLSMLRTHENTLLRRIQENSEEEKESKLTEELKEARAQIKLQRETLEEKEQSSSNPSQSSDRVTTLEDYSSPSLSLSNSSSTSSMVGLPVSDISPENEDKRIQNEFECVISTCIMEDPVVTSAGTSYERDGIERWLAQEQKKEEEREEKKGIRDPHRNMLTDITLRPNITLRNVIQQFQETGRVTSGVRMHYICPLSHELMKNPVVAADGYSYEYKRINEWFAENSTSPVTGELLSDRTLWPNLVLKNVIDWFPKTPLNEVQLKTIEDCIDIVVRTLSNQPNARQLLEAVLDPEPESPLLLQIINQEEPQIRSLLVNARQLVLGNDILVHKNHHEEYVTLQRLSAHPSILSGNINVENVEAKDIASYARVYLVNSYQLVTPTIDRIHNAFDEPQINNLFDSVMAGQQDEQQNEPDDDGLPAWLRAIKNFFCGVGRGVYNFVVHTFVDPLLLIYRLVTKPEYRTQTWDGLRFAFNNPMVFFRTLWNNLCQYASNDPVAFGTELVLNLALIGLFFLPTPSPAGPGSAAAVANTLEKLPLMSTMTKMGAGVSHVSKLTSPLLPISRMASVAPTIASSLAKVSSVVVPTVTTLTTTTTTVAKQASTVSKPEGIVSKPGSMAKTVLTSSSTTVKETSKSVVPFKDLPRAEQARVALKQPQVRLVTQVLKKRLIDQAIQNNFKSDKGTTKIKINLFDDPKTVYIDSRKPEKVKINMFTSVNSIQSVSASTSESPLGVIPVPKAMPIPTKYDEKLRRSGIHNSVKVEKQKSMGTVVTKPKKLTTTTSSSVVPSYSSTSQFRLVGAPARTSSSSSSSSSSTPTMRYQKG